MKIARNRTMATLIALFLVLTMAATLITCLPTVNAMDIVNYAFIVVAPNPVGVGQTATVSFWLDKLPPYDVPGGDPVGLRFNGYYIDIEKPDGTKTTLGPYTSDYTGAYNIKYTPDKTGTYYFTFRYDGENKTSRRASGQPVATDYYKPAVSKRLSLTVQEEPIAAYPGVPLPTGYWERPIYGENREWASLGGNWLGVPVMQMGTACNSTGAYNPYTPPLTTAHIMWTKPVMIGGIVGGATDNAFYSGLSYEEYWNPPTALIIAGRLYYNTRASSNRIEGLVCADLRTGEEIWFRNGSTSQLFGQLLDFETFNEHGVLQYLWSTGSTYWAYEAWNGDVAFHIVNATSPSRITTDDMGSVLAYCISSSNDWLLLWNSTHCINPTDSPTWSPSPTTNYTWRNGIMWNVTIPHIPGQTIITVGSNVILTSAIFMTDYVRMVSGYNALTGAHLWTINITDFNQRAQYNFSPILNGYFGWYKQETKTWYGYDAQTGKQVWQATPFESDFAEYFASYRGAGPSNPTVGYGTIYTTCYDGYIHAIDISNGTRLWDFSTGSSGFETPYGTWPFYGGATVAGGVVYASTNEHTPNDPFWRGGKLYAVNATTGDLVWSISAWMPGTIIADGYLAGVNYYDGQLYTFGKGQTATTVTATPKVTMQGNSIVIEGTVTDQTPDAHLKGTPAIADASMTQWMTYIFQQKPRPTNATGVPVTLDAIDPNGNYIHIGDATSDSSGLYSYAWTTPNVPGKYTIIATFGGSGAYYASFTETSAVVSEAPPATPPPQYPIPTDYTLPIVAATIVLLIAIAIVGLMILRKRP